jgi:hypothetical protein
MKAKMTKLKREEETGSMIMPKNGSSSLHSPFRFAWRRGGAKCSEPMLNFKALRQHRQSRLGMHVSGVVSARF